MGGPGPAEARSVGARRPAAAADRAAPPAVVATLPGVAGPATAVFGLTEIEPPAGAPDALRADLLELTRRRLAFGRVQLLAALLEARRPPLGGLEWRPLDLAGGAAWGEDVAAGDLLRVGARVVVLDRDADASTPGTPGVLDPDDLCLDYARGAAARRLGDVFAAARARPATSSGRASTTLRPVSGRR